MRGHHSKVLTIGDCTKDDIQEYDNDRLLSDIPSEPQLLQDPRLRGSVMQPHLPNS
jgi:hypothetical protein